MLNIRACLISWKSDFYCLRNPFWRHVKLMMMCYVVCSAGSRRWRNWRVVWHPQWISRIYFFQPGKGLSVWLSVSLSSGTTARDYDNSNVTYSIIAVRICELENNSTQRLIHLCYLEQYSTQETSIASILLQLNCHWSKNNIGARQSSESAVLGDRARQNSRFLQIESTFPGPRRLQMLLSLFWHVSLPWSIF